MSPPLVSAGPLLPAIDGVLIFAPVVVFDGLPSEAARGEVTLLPGSMTATVGRPTAGMGIGFAQGESVSRACASFWVQPLKSLACQAAFVAANVASKETDKTPTLTAPRRTSTSGDQTAAGTPKCQHACYAFEVGPDRWVSG